MSDVDVALVSGSRHLRMEGQPRQSCQPSRDTTVINQASKPAADGNGQTSGAAYCSSHLVLLFVLVFSIQQPPDVADFDLASELERTARTTPSLQDRLITRRTFSRSGVISALLAFTRSRPNTTRKLPVFAVFNAKQKRYGCQSWLGDHRRFQKLKNQRIGYGRDRFNIVQANGREVRTDTMAEHQQLALSRCMSNRLFQIRDFGSRFRLPALAIYVGDAAIRCFSVIPATKQRRELG